MKTNNEKHTKKMHGTFSKSANPGGRFHKTVFEATQKS